MHFLFFKVLPSFTVMHFFFWKSIHQNKATQSHGAPQTVSIRKKRPSNLRSPVLSIAKLYVWAKFQNKNVGLTIVFETFPRDAAHLIENDL